MRHCILGKSKMQKMVCNRIPFLKMNNRKCLLYMCIYIVFTVAKYITVNECHEYIEKYKRINAVGGISETNR